MKTTPVRLRDDEASVIGDHKSISIPGIDPDVVSVAAPSHGCEDLAAVHRMMKAAVGDEHFVLIRGRDLNADVVASASDERSIPVDDFPLLAAIVRSPN